MSWSRSRGGGSREEDNRNQQAFAQNRTKCLTGELSTAGKSEPESSGGGSRSSDEDDQLAFAPRLRPDGTPAGPKRRARSGPLSPEGAEEAGDSVAEARARGEAFVALPFVSFII